jgi:hypothetical protein
MTFLEAKDITVKVWSYLRDNPLIGNENDNKEKALPPELFALIKNYKGQCALCEVFPYCVNCPLDINGNCCYHKDSFYAKWNMADTLEKKSYYAGLMVCHVHNSDMEKYDKPFYVLNKRKHA